MTEFDLRCVEMGLGLAKTCQTLDLIGKNLRWSLLIGLDVKQDKSRPVIEMRVLLNVQVDLFYVNILLMLRWTPFIDATKMFQLTYLMI